MFADPISFNVDNNAQNHTRVGLSNGTGEFSWNDGARRVTIKQSSNTKRFRREVRVAAGAVVDNPVNGQPTEVGFSVYLVIDEPRFGWTDDQLKNAVKDLCAFLTADSAGNTQRVLNGEY